MRDSTKYCVLLLFLLFILTFSYQVRAQKSNFSFQHFGVDQSMSSSNVGSIYQDHKGYLWFLTDQGLDRFDGYNFITYKYPINSKVIRVFMPGTIAEDRDGNIWVGSINGGIEKFNPETQTFKNYLTDPEHPVTEWGNRVLEIFIDKKNVMWIGTAYGFYKFNKSSDSFTQFLHNEDDPNSLGHNSVNGIYEDNSGTLWLATGGGLDKFDSETNKFYHYWHYPNNQWGNPKTRQYWLQAIVEDGKGVLWIGTDGGLLKFDKNTEAFTFYNNNPNTSIGLARNTVLSLCIDGAGLIWLGTRHGIDIFNKNAKTFTNYFYKASDLESLSADDISAIILDSSGSMWISTTSRGVNKLDIPSQVFKIYKNNPNLLDNSTVDLSDVIDLFEDSEGSFWVGTHQAWGILDSKSNRIISKYNYGDWGIGHDISGNKLIAPTVGGLYKLNKNNTWTCYVDSVAATFSEYYNSFYQRSNDYFWIGSYDGNLYSFNPFTKEIKWITNIKSTIYTIYEDSYGLVWYGGYSTGIFCYDPNKNLISEYLSVSTDSSTIIDNSFFSFFEDKNKTLWFGCGTGLVKFNRLKNNFTRFYGKDNFLNNRVRHILEDENGNLWMSTGKGVTKFNPLTEQFNNYYASNYFPEIKFYSRTGCKTKNGEMYFGGENGFVRFHPDSIKDDTFIPPIVITSFKKFEKSFPFGEKIELSHTDNFISFEFAALSYFNSEENQYAYMMEGIDKDWVYCGTRRFATYPNLNPGEYTFKVKGSNCNRVWNEKGAAVKIIILPPWWRTNIAYLFYILFIAGTIYFTWKMQLKRIRTKHEFEMSKFEAQKLHEVDELKSRFFTNISHEFRTPLTLIQGPAKQIMENTNESQTKDSANFIYRNSLKLIRLVNQLLDLSKLEAGELTIRAAQTDVIAFIKEIVLSFTPLADRKKITLKLNHDEEKILAYLDKDKIYKITNNILSNAFKFTAEYGNIDVSIVKNNSMVEIKISDTGIGIPKEKIDKIFDRFYQVDGSHTREQEGTGIGLALTKELVELHKGKIEIESKEGEGSTFTISFPLGNDHLKPEQIVEIDKSEDHILSLQEDDPTLYSSYQNKFDTESLTHPQKPTLLVVEDNPDVRSFIKGIFKNEYEIYEASNGGEGMKISFEKIPDLIISDLMMPNMDGFEMCNKIKNDERTSHIPVIMLTAKATNKDRIEGYETGADDYITKPFDEEILRARVKNLVEQRKKLKEHFIKDGLFSLDDKNITQVDKIFLQKAVQIVNDHISDISFGVETFASDIALSRVTLHKKLTSLIGESPSELIKRIRLSKAAKLLQNKHENISEIALDVGFNNPAYFSECFRKQFGVSPSQYQQKFTIH